jgi:hypothetical protein
MPDDRKPRDIELQEQYLVSTKRSNLPEVRTFNAKEMKYLDIYSETLDHKQALKDSGLVFRQFRNNLFLQAEVARINELSLYRFRSRQALMNHHRLLDKFEDHYDKAVEKEDGKSAVGYSGTLARMSDSALRAAGHYDKGKDDGVDVLMPTVNIFIGGEAKEVKAEVQGEVIDVDTN